MDGTILNKKYNLAERVKALEESGGGDVEFKVFKYTGVGGNNHTIDFGDVKPKVIFGICPDPEKDLKPNTNYECIEGFPYGQKLAATHWSEVRGGDPAGTGGSGYLRLGFDGNTVTIMGANPGSACNNTGQDYCVYYI